MALRPGILAALPTPFTAGGDLDRTSLGRVVRDAVAAGADGLLAAVRAGEVDALSDAEREAVARTVAEVNRDAVPWVLGASAPGIEGVHRHAALARELGASAFLVAVPAPFYGRPEDIVPFFRAVAAGHDTPLLVEDSEPGGQGMDLAVLRALRDAVPTLAGILVEASPFGPKLSALAGAGSFVCAGRALSQLVEALDRGCQAAVVDASVARVAKAVDRAHRGGDRGRAVEIFRRLAPVLAFPERDALTSIAFGKRLLKRKGLIESAATRVPFPWDEWNRRAADEAIDLYREAEGAAG